MYPASGQKDERSKQAMDRQFPLRHEISYRPPGPGARSGQMASANQQSGPRYHTGQRLKKKKYGRFKHR
ncbi:hypothetical protein Y032_0002g907 [Ancylostoma ceylanicum]|uniref:Uncharacterized protein n=1 Tax=Ancylostoma ceylanicum TaxID=53326 RepID=A0A016W1W6_9BILA|nr:hypothetical protein Y032_0002g907 [Ancylostoma ceylanicum]